MNKSLAAGAIALLLPWLGGGAIAQDEGAPEPWELTFTHKSLEAVTVPYKDGSARTVYVLPFTVENKSGATADLALHFRATVGTNPRKQKLHLALPDPDAEEFVRRMARAPDMLGVADINRHNAAEQGTGKLAPGEKLQGVAVFGEFSREWDKAVITITGLESGAIAARVRKYGDAGFTLAHRAYGRHNAEVKQAAGEGAPTTDVHAIVQHRVVWTMHFSRKGDEYAPQLDPITLDREEWDVLEAPPPAIVYTKFE
jgi:hypothetical protein